MNEEQSLRPVLNLLEHIGGGKLMRNLSPMRIAEATEVMGKHFPEFFADFFNNLDSIDTEWKKLKSKDNIPLQVQDYVFEAIRSYICSQYIAASICSTVAVEASLKNIYSINTSLDQFFVNEKGKNKKPEKFSEYIEWGHQVKVLPKHTRMFSDGMRMIRNDLAHANEFNAKENAKSMIVNMTNIILEIYQ